METWGQKQKGFEKEMSDKETRHEKEAEKAQKVIEKERSDVEACHKKETEKAKRGTREVETWDQTQSEEDNEDDKTPVSKTGLGNYYPNPMYCGDCSFETHYESENSFSS